MGDDCEVLDNGNVIGTLHYVNDYKEYDENNPEMQKGNFFVIKLAAKYEGKDISCQRNDQEKPKVVQDTSWVLRVPSKDTTFTFKDGEDIIITLKFKNATLENMQ